jgi:hypothetical protein
MEEWFKMMGGLRSILELGVAFLALTNFCITFSDLMKKFMAYSKETSLSMAKYIESKLPTKAIGRLISPEQRGKTLRSLLFVVLRVFAGLLLFLGLKMRRDFKRECKRREEEMMRELESIKEQEIEMEDESVIEERQREEEGAHDANL